MIALYVIIGLIFLSMEVATLVVYGNPISKTVEDKYLKLINLDNYRLNYLDHKILSDKTSFKFITNVTFSLISRYHIDTVGIIPRWSPLHNQIKETFKQAKEDYNKNTNQ